VAKCSHDILSSLSAFEKDVGNAMGLGPLINLQSTGIILATEKQNYCVWI